MKARVFVSPKPTVLDPQGQAVCSALRGLGHQAIADVRQGKFFDIALAPGPPANRRGRISRPSRTKSWPIPSSKSTALRFWTNRNPA